MTTRQERQANEIGIAMHEALLVLAAAIQTAGPAGDDHVLLPLAAWVRYVERWKALSSRASEGDKS